MKDYIVTVNGVQYEVSVEEKNPGSVSQAPVAPKAAPAPVAAAPKAAPVKAAAPAQAAGSKAIKAPMPGNILDVKVAVGAKVSKGDVVVVLEAMKMENDIAAPEDGTIASISVSKGSLVNTGDVLVTYSA